jgi:hypothetical protein
MPVPASAIPRLRPIADHYARGDSLTAPHWASVVTTSHNKALASVTPPEEATLGVGNVGVYLIRLLNFAQPPAVNADRRC